MEYKKGDFWERFDPTVYVGDNYAVIHDEDKEIIERLVKFYASLSPLGQSLEIGGGPNLYPLMLALPYVKRIDIVDISLRNVSYLKRQMRQPDANWYLFWDLLKKLNLQYQDINLTRDLTKKVRVGWGNIYELPENKYDLASMFFCAESITDKTEDFVLACKKFIGSVKRGGILVAAFMENSEGYVIVRRRFPAISVNGIILKRIFLPKTRNLCIYRIPKAARALRSGYTGMLLLTATSLN